MARKSRRCSAQRPIGLILMVSGAIVLLFCVPEWLWTAFIGIALIAVGFLCWRYG